ncbi:hypothetical protein BS47DRAFT_1060905 [Hydnum rufescens UP504]|uniref:Uncharacterized protein n=1 Tax=Hydnum rufescens UP504 TaxID=1448309 RepID=A0A9P6AW38_9AGAM|nr:hypothetical protein BS47DRAFT_1060905 [Hydnum rufescens UP504]
MDSVSVGSFPQDNHKLSEGVEPLVYPYKLRATIDGRLEEYCRQAPRTVLSNYQIQYCQCLKGEFSLLVLPWTDHDLGFTLYAWLFSHRACLYHESPLLGSAFVERKPRGRDRLKGNQLEMFLIRSLLFPTLLILPVQPGYHGLQTPYSLGSPLLSVVREQFPHQQLSVSFCPDLLAVSYNPWLPR